MGRTDDDGALTIPRLRVHYPRIEIDLPPLTFAPGVTLVAGPNGSGKTTLLRAMAGDLPRHRLRSTWRMPTPDVAYLPQNPSLPRDIACRDLVAYALWLGGGSWGAARARGPRSPPPCASPSPPRRAPSRPRRAR